jgi:hypothetical protein
MAVEDNGSHSPVSEKQDVAHNEKGDVAVTHTNNIGAGAEAPMTWKTWVVIFVCR